MPRITDDRGLAYDFAKKRRRAGTRWFTVKDLAEGAMITPASAQQQASWFSDMRIFECKSSVRPRSYRLIKPHLSHTEWLVRQIEDALEVILPRKREEARQQNEFFARNKSRYPQRPPGRRRPSRGPNGGATTHPNNGGPHPSGTGPTPGGRGPRPNGHGPSFGTRGSSSPNGGSANDNVGAPRSSRSSKAEQLIEVLSRPGGASMDELITHFGTKPHSIRALISVSTRERGLKASLEDGRYRVG